MKRNLMIVTMLSSFLLYFMFSCKHSSSDDDSSYNTDNDTQADHYNSVEDLINFNTKVGTLSKVYIDGYKWTMFVTEKAENTYKFRKKVYPYKVTISNNENEELSDRCFELRKTNKNLNIIAFKRNPTDVIHIYSCLKDSVDKMQAVTTESTWASKISDYSISDFMQTAISNLCSVTESSPDKLIVTSTKTLRFDDCFGEPSGWGLSDNCYDVELNKNGSTEFTYEQTSDKIFKIKKDGKEVCNFIPNKTMFEQGYN